VRTTLGAALETFTAQPPKGEFVLVVAGAPIQEKEGATEEEAMTRVKALMSQGISRKDAVKQTAKELDLPKNVVYDAALRIDPQ
jgi:16S rRNA (cytidine1402-2'-O)-methyltransferase